MSSAPNPLEAFRRFVAEIIRWALYEPPGEAVSGKLDVKFRPLDEKDKP